jgi:hypothetical protein
LTAILRSGSEEVRSTTLFVEEETVFVAFPCHMLLPLGDGLYKQRRPSRTLRDPRFTAACNRGLFPRRSSRGVTKPSRLYLLVEIERTLKFYVVELHDVHSRYCCPIPRGL